MTSLPPISSTIFQEQILNRPSEDDSEKQNPDFSRTCDKCYQHFANRKVWQAHLKSRNHVNKVAETNNAASSSVFDSPRQTRTDTQQSFEPLICLFCDNESVSLDANLGHMTRAHSFFIPDAEHLIDIESFLSYLFIIVSELNQCLFCGSLKGSKTGTQGHMRDKGHCRINTDDDENGFEEFYEFSDDSEEEIEDVNTGTILHPDDYERQLPSGRIVGHRSIVRQSHQHHMRRQKSATPPIQLLGETGANPMIPESSDRSVATRAGTSTSLVGVPELRQRALIAMEKKMERLEAVAKNEYQSKVDRKGNKQKRFRVVTIGKKAGGLEKRNG